MKKRIFLLAILLCTAPGLLAQEFSERVAFDSSADFSIGEGTVSFEPLSYIGWGYHKPVEAMDYTLQNAINDEFFLNIVELRASLYDRGRITLGVDWDRDCYRLDRSFRWVTGEDRKSVAIASRGGLAIRKSNLIVNTFSFPLGFEHEMGSWLIRADVALDCNLPAKIRAKAVNANGEKIKSVVKGIPTRTVTYHVTGTVSYGGLGLYFRYNLQPQFEEGVGPEFRAFTIGLVWGLGM